jgi:UDP-2,4-diacetamido-2,4,6-trideoxy-beta-L-altropyranose hydrolase
VTGFHVVFCAQASPEIGAGHIMRCLTLADALARRGGVCRFVTTPETLPTVPALGGAGHGVTAIAAAAFAEPTALAAAAGGADLAVVDDYRLGADAEAALSAGGVRLVMAIDDLACRRHAAALLLDQTLGRRAADYAGLVPAACRLLLGPDYALLRPQFAHARPAALERRQRPGPVRRLLVAMGGTDPADATGLVLAALALGNPGRPEASNSEAGNRELAVDVVLGRAAPGLAAVRARVAALAGVTLHVDVADMAALIGAADLAVGAAGTASWERCCLGLPTLALVLADNQETVCRALAEAGAIVPAGPAAALAPAALAASLAALIADPERRHRLATRALALCDGTGADRVADLLTESLGCPKTFHPFAIAGDATLAP